MNAGMRSWCDGFWAGVPAGSGPVTPPARQGKCVRRDIGWHNTTGGIARLIVGALGNTSLGPLFFFETKDSL